MKTFKATIVKRYTIKENQTRYYYYNLEGGFIENTEAFTKGMQDPQTESNLIKNLNVINVCYEVKFCNGTQIGFIDDLNEALIFARKYVNLSYLKPGKRYTEVDGVYTEVVKISQKTIKQKRKYEN